MRDERFPIEDEEGFDHVRVLPTLDTLESRIDEISIERLRHHDLNLIIQPGLSMPGNPGCIVMGSLYKIPLGCLAVLPISKTTRVIQCPGNGAVIIIIFNSNAEDHGFSPCWLSFYRLRATSVCTRRSGADEECKPEDY